MNPAALFGLLSALVYGAGDFAAGYASKTDPPVRLAALTHPVAALLFALIALLTGEALPPLSSLLWGATAGLVGLIGILAFYRGLALGPMGAVSVTAGSLSAVIPAVWGLALGERLGVGGLTGAALVLLGIAALSAVPGGGRGGLTLAVFAGVGFGLFFVLLARAEGGTFWVLAAARAASALVMLPVAAATVGLRPTRPGLVGLALPGDAAGNLLYLLSAQAGRLAVAGVLSSLYPAVTTLLAAWLLRERLRPLQWLGAGLALTGAALVATA